MLNKNILLASVAGSFVRRFASELVKSGQTIKKLRTVFVTTAANLYAEKPWMEKDMVEFEQAGFQVQLLDICAKSHDELVELLSSTDLLIMAGGNTMFLLEELQKKELLTKIQTRVHEGMGYVGSSAGAVIASPDIQLEKHFDDRKHPPQLSSYAGLELCQFHVLPHWGSKPFKQEYLSMLKHGYEQNIPLVSLTDQQALIGDGTRWEYWRV